MGRYSPPLRERNVGIFSSGFELIAVQIDFEALLCGNGIRLNYVDQYCCQGVFSQDRIGFGADGAAAASNQIGRFGMTGLAKAASSDGEEILQVGAILASHPEHRRGAHEQRFESGSGFAQGRVCALEETYVPITDLGFNRADAVYDVVTVGRGNFFRLEDHFSRFARSCEMMKLRNPYGEEELRHILNRLVALTGLKDAYVWWGVTRGAMPLKPRDRLNPEGFSNRFYAFVTPYIFICNDEQRTRGIDIRISADYVRIPPNSVDPRAKNFHGLDLALSLFEAGRFESDWSVLTDGKGNLAEAPGSNIFVIKNGVVATPEIGCLEGITRLTALDLCGDLGLECEVRPVKSAELAGADEAFLTSSAGGIMPIASVNGVRLKGGPLCSALHNAYWEKRRAGWHSTPVDYARID